MRAILTYSVNAFNSIIHHFLTAKLNANGFEKKELNVIDNHLFWRSQKTKMVSSSSNFLGIFYSVPQSSRFRILGSLIFNTNSCGLFLSQYASEFRNFTNDSTLYECSKIYLMRSWANFKTQKKTRITGYSETILR